MKKIENTITKLTNSVEKAKTELKEVCANKEYPLWERVVLFDDAPDFLKEHSKYGARNCPLLNQKIFGGDQSRYTTVNITKYLENFRNFQAELQDLDSPYLAESITEDEFELIPGSYNFYDTHELLKEDIKLVEEILAAQIGFATIDW